MKKSVEEHAERFSAKAAEYDESKTDEYHACANLVIEHAAPDADDVVIDLGAGTGAIGLSLAPDADRVVLRDVSAGMLEQAREKIADRELDNVETAEGTFREPDYAGPADVVVSNFALHHLSDAEKREAIEVMADFEPERIVLGDVMFFGSPDPAAEFYSPEVDDPSTVGHLVDCFTDAGYAITTVERVHDQIGVLVAERIDDGNSGE
ncbi:MAG: class I SAM-dependent methyltransferase [Halopenitus sp.]